MNFKTIQNFTFVAVLFLVSIAFLWILKSYVMPIFWALVLAIIFAPVNDFIRKKFSKLKYKSVLSASATLLFIILLIIIPSSILGAVFLKELHSLYNLVTGMEGTGAYLDSIISVLHNSLHISLSVSDIQDKLSSAISTYGKNISQLAYGVGKLSLNFIVKFFVMLYILFFFFKDGDKWVRRIMEIMPLGSKNEDYLLRKFSNMVRAVFKGSVVLALLQGALGGILFWIVGIQSPVVWAALMMLFAFIPAVGPAIIWAPASLILFLTGDVSSAIVLLLGGVFLIGMIDNLMRPLLVGRGTDMPDLLIFVSVLGALAEFGMAGLVIGPVLAALFLAVWELFEKKFKTDLKKWG